MENYACQTRWTKFVLSFVSLGSQLIGNQQSHAVDGQNMTKSAWTNNQWPA